MAVNLRASTGLTRKAIEWLEPVAFADSTSISTAIPDLIVTGA
jgi:hypothetical protein